MKALVYHGPGKKAWEQVPDTVIQEPTDVVVRVDTTTICGTDLHILQGDVAAAPEGRPRRLLPAGHAVALPDGRRDRLDLRAPDRRHPGRGGPGPLRRHLAVRG